MRQTLLALLSVVGVMSVPAILEEGRNCTGEYSADVNALFLHCYDANGTVSFTAQTYFTSTLAKECSSLEEDELNSMLEDIIVKVEIGDRSEAKEVCHYFEAGKGYQFSLFEGKENEEVFVVPDVVGNERDEFYKAVTEDEALFWNWTELADLINEYAQAQCDLEVAPSGSENAELPLEEGTRLEDLLRDLNLPLEDWLAIAEVNDKLETLSKEELKQWVEYYIEFRREISLLAKDMDIVDLKIDTAKEVTLEDIWKPEFEEEIRTTADIITELENTEGGKEFLDWFNFLFGEKGIARFVFGEEKASEEEKLLGGEEDIEEEIIDEEKHLIEEGEEILEEEEKMIEEELPEESGAEQKEIPEGMEAIVNWVTENFFKELRQRRKEFNVTEFEEEEVFNATGLEGEEELFNETEIDEGEEELELFNETEALNVTDEEFDIEASGTEEEEIIEGEMEKIPFFEFNITFNATEEVEPEEEFMFFFDTYQVPEGCEFTGEKTERICCEKEGKNVCFTIEEMNDWWSQRNETCLDFMDVHDVCEEEGDVGQCLRMSLYNKFLLREEERMYGWLAFDHEARNKLFDHCMAQTEEEIEHELFDAAFQFNFPNLGE